MQDIIVYIIIATAGFFVMMNIYRLVKNSKNKANSACASCSLKNKCSDKKMQHRTQLTVKKATNISKNDLGK